MRDYIIFDEMSATIMGGFFQRRMMVIDNSDIDYSHSGNEFDFFQVKGPLDQATEHIRSYMISNNPGADIYEIKSLLSNPMSLSVGLGFMARYGDKESVQFFCDMHEIITEGYFGNADPNCEELSQMIWSPSVSVGYNLGRLNKARKAWPNKGYDFDDVFEEYVKFFNILEERSVKPSPICKAIEKSQNNGELDDYIGTAIAPGGGGNDGVRPILPCKRVHL